VTSTLTTRTARKANTDIVASKRALGALLQALTEGDYLDAISLLNSESLTPKRMASVLLGRELTTEEAGYLHEASNQGHSEHRISVKPRIDNRYKHGVSRSFALAHSHAFVAKVPKVPAYIRPIVGQVQEYKELVTSARAHVRKGNISTNIISQFKRFVEGCEQSKR
jgi:hypothetical protein